MKSNDDMSTLKAESSELEDIVDIDITSPSTEVDEDSTKEAVPEELQCEEVDMNDHLMDPLEWTVRKTIYIPKKYYWETGNYDVSFRTKTWHRSVQSMGIALRGAENVGGFVAGLLGLNNSRFDDVTAYMTDEEWEVARENARRDKEKRKAYLAQKENEKISAA